MACEGIPVPGMRPWRHRPDTLAPLAQMCQTSSHLLFRFSVVTLFYYSWVHGTNDIITVIIALAQLPDKYVKKEVVQLRQELV